MRAFLVPCSLLALVVPACADPVERIATGFGFAEGPAWNARTGELFFSDVRLDRVHVIPPDGSVRSWLESSGGANGLAFDIEGRLLACCGKARELVRFELDGERTVLASSFGGKRLNSPNDLALDASGGVWFTDPRFGDASDLEQDAMAVYYLASDGTLTRATSDSVRPNGVVLTHDGESLWVAEPNLRELRLYPVLGPGRLGEPRVAFRGDPELDGAGPDGLAIDAEGRLYSTWTGIVVHAPDGTLLRRIPIPEHTANCTLGGEAGRTLFVTARTSVYRVELQELLTWRE
jgi:gluconolactonase